MLSINSKLDFIFKKFNYKQHTSEEKEWYEEKDGFFIFPTASEIWIDLIPNTPPTKDTKSIKIIKNYKLMPDKSSNNLSYYVIDENKNRIKNFIKPSYGLEYNIKIYLNGEKLPTAHPSNWIFDYENGILTLEKEINGELTIDGYVYIGNTLKTYLDHDFNSVAKGILGLDNPQKEYIIQHNLNSYDLDITIYSYEEIEGNKYWKKDVIPFIMLDKNKVKVQLSEETPIKFIIKKYELI